MAALLLVALLAFGSARQANQASTAQLLAESHAGSPSSGEGAIPE
ncbi:MAG: hypothetical protein WAU45_03335 [Blastocatellia bacterium]